MTEIRRDTARELIRQLIEDERREAVRQEAKDERLRTLMRAGKASGLQATQIAAASGLSRPSVYEALRREAQGPAEGLEEIVLAMIAARGASTRASLAGLLGANESDVSSAIERLSQQGAVKYGAAGYEGGTMQEIVLLNPEGEQFLEDRLRRALHGRPEQWTAYLAVQQAEAGALAEAAEIRFGKHRTALIPEKTTPRMEDPELAIGFDVTNQVDLFNEAAEAWHSLRADVPLDPAPVKVVAFSPSRGYSEILEAAGRGIVEANPKTERKVARAVAEAGPQDDEFTICVRALTEAAWALRRAVGQEKRPTRLSTSEDAFEELQAVIGLSLDKSREKVQKALIKALKRATDRLGPIPGGRLGSFRGPDEDPHFVAGVTPTVSDLTKIAEASGQALGYAHAATAGKVDAIEAIRIVSGSGDK